MDFPMDGKRLPLGFRFHPTDEELLMYYLKRKILGKRIHGDVMSDLDIYKFGPWDLPKLALLQTREREWYYFCPRGKKYTSSGRTNRATECGYWKATGNDRTVQYRDRDVGKIKTLIFHLGKPPKGERQDWVMHEYRLDDAQLGGVAQDAYVICKLFKKSGLGPKNGEQYGAPFIEEEWEDADERVTQGGDALGTETECTGGALTYTNQDQENSSVSAIVECTNNHGGPAPISFEQAPHENGTLASVDQALANTNACKDIVLPPQKAPFVINCSSNEFSIDELLVPFDNCGDAGMTSQQGEQMHFNDIFGNLEFLDEFHYSSHFNSAFTPHPFGPDGDFLEVGDLDNDEI